LLNLVQLAGLGKALRHDRCCSQPMPR